jgi:hypothetical protein
MRHCTAGSSCVKRSAGHIILRSTVLIRVLLCIQDICRCKWHHAKARYSHICNSWEWESNSLVTGPGGRKVSESAGTPLFILARIRSRTRRASHTTSSSPPTNSPCPINKSRTLLLTRESGKRMAASFAPTAVRLPGCTRRGRTTRCSGLGPGPAEGR